MNAASFLTAMARDQSYLRFGRVFLTLLILLLTTVFCAPIAAQNLDDNDSPPIEEIVVTARYGEARVESETELDEDDIDTYGAGTIGELVSQITPLTGRPEEQPIVLVNGQRVDGAGGVNGFPPEALARLAILKPEAAERYGYSSGQRVVNLVLKKSFSSWQAEAGAKFATAGGRESGQFALGRFVVAGRSRWNARFQLSRDNALLKSDRVDDRGFDRDDAHRTLLPASNSISLNVGVARPLGEFTGAINMDVNRRSQQQLLGTAFPGGVDGALRGEQETNNIGLSATLTGSIADWQSNIALRYSRSWSDNDIERLIANSYIVTDRSSSRSENLTGQINLNRPILTLPAGPVTSNISINATRNWSLTQSSGVATTLPVETVFRRQQIDARVSLSLPISQSGSAGFSVLGDMSLDVAAAGSMASGAPLRNRFELGANWSPFAALQLRATAAFTQLIPTADQIGGPYVEEIRRIYDFRREEIADVLWITGGNPDLNRGKQNLYSLSATIRPLARPILTLTSEYQRHISTGGVGAFPAFTPVVEFAFPDRIQRDASGHLLSVDARAINIVHDIDEQLNNGLIITLTPKGRGRTDAAGQTARAEAPTAPWRVNFSVSHGWLLRSDLLTRPGIPPIDRLSGDTGQSRHQVRFQLTVGRSGVGGVVSGSWQSGFRLRSPANPGSARDFHHKAVTTMNLRLFAEPDRLFSTSQKPSWLSDLNISFDIRNLFDSYRQVVLSNGSIPAGYRRYDINPLGRTAQVSLRKRF
ncbi:hypothetical protein [Parasphingorhabdus sp.]|uniref:hypothetical protein n=1 Tax=Parasphingorhabdus sp. TaxID=2709688 RepID=UPI002F94A1DD